MSSITNLFSFTTEDVCDVERLSKLEFSDTFETLLHVRLDTVRIFGLRKNLQHLVVRQEKKSEYEFIVE